MSDVTEDLNAYGFSTEVRVRLSETDAVGIVFFGSFSVYFDVGRMDYLANLELEEFGGAVRDLIPGAVVAQTCRFRSPAKYNDILVMNVRIAHIGTTSYTFHFLMTHRRDRKVVATGTLTLVWMDGGFKPVRVPDGFRETVGAFEGDNLKDALP